MNSKTNNIPTSPANAGEGSGEGGIFFTLIVFSENLAGLLNQVTSVFTRRQVNIESLNVSPSSIEGVHKYTITCYSDEEEIKLICRLIEKKVDVLQANYYTDDEIFISETALFKLETPKVIDNPQISRIIRHEGGRILEVNPTYTVVTVKGSTDHILDTYKQLAAEKCVLQYVRSGRIAVTRSCTEYLDEFLAERKRQYEAMP